MIRRYLRHDTIKLDAAKLNIKNVTAKRRQGKIKDLLNCFECFFDVPLRRE